MCFIINKTLNDTKTILYRIYFLPKQSLINLNEKMFKVLSFLMTFDQNFFQNVSGFSVFCFA